jgi:hypothetical protein
MLAPRYVTRGAEVVYPTNYWAKHRLRYAAIHFPSLVSIQAQSTETSSLIALLQSPLEVAGRD